MPTNHKQCLVKEGSVITMILNSCPHLMKTFPIWQLHTPMSDGEFDRWTSSKGQVIHWCSDYFCKGEFLEKASDNHSKVRLAP